MVGFNSWQLNKPNSGNQATADDGHCLIEHFVQLLLEYRSFTGACRAPGLDMAIIKSFLAIDPDLRDVIKQAHRLALFPNPHDLAEQEINRLLRLPEAEAVTVCQQNLSNFYPNENISAVFPVAGKGGWYIGHKGVFYDVASYGKDPFGHNPPVILETLSHPVVSKNMMYANIHQKLLAENLANALGISQESFVYQVNNTGSDGMELALVHVDCYHKYLVDQCDYPEDIKPSVIVMESSFHGRTARPSELSDSTRVKYQKAFVHCERSYHIATVDINDGAALKLMVKELTTAGRPPIAMALEPIQGEGNPGIAISAEYWQLCYQLAHSESEDRPRFLLLADSVQAGAWRSGEFSLFSFPEYRATGRPDFEVFSKAIGGSREAISLLVIDKPSSGYFQKGVYGNTRAGNPHGLAVVNKVFELMTLEVKTNILERSAQFLAGFLELQNQYPTIIKAVQGTGLLLALKIDTQVVPVVDPSKGLETLLRLQGVDIIHGGKNDHLRLTPNYLITTEQVQLVIFSIGRILSEVVNPEGSSV